MESSHLPTEISPTCEELVPTDILMYNLLYILKKAFCCNIYFDRGRDWECLCKIRLVFIYDGFLHAEKKIAHFDKTGPSICCTCEVCL